jgi:chromosome segregation ATPase
VLQFLLRPKPKESSFDQSIEKFNKSLEDFNAMNNQLQLQSQRLDSVRDSLDAKYEERRRSLDDQVGLIGNKITSLDRTYARISNEMDVLRSQWNASNAPDTIPTLSSLIFRQ